MMRYIILSFLYSFFIAINKSDVIIKIINFFKDFLIDFKTLNNDFFNNFSLLIFVL